LRLLEWLEYCRIISSNCFADSFEILSSLSKRTYIVYADGVQSQAGSAKHQRTEKESQLPMEVPLSANEIVRRALRSLLPQAVEDIMVSAAMRDVLVL
jgi:hypothetical protein